MNKLISVIVPVYNAEKYLERCLESIVTQTYPHLEIIVVNDGSTDQSPKLINRFVEKNTGIIAVHQKNKGVSAARNEGLSRAKGDLIGFVDADDVILPDMYQFLLSNLLENDADISHCGFELVKKNSTVKFHDTGVFLVQDKNQAIAELLSGNRIEPSSCTKLYKKSVLNNVRFAEGIKWNEDLLFNVQAFNNAEKSVFHDIVKYRYMQNAQSASQQSFSLEMAESIYRVSVEIKESLTDEKSKRAVDVFYASKVVTLLQQVNRNGLQSAGFTKRLKKEATQLNLKGMGFRLQFLKFLLIKIPFLYGLFRYIYDLFFTKEQKWKDH